jgi:hypothetical protein
MLHRNYSAFTLALAVSMMASILSRASSMLTSSSMRNPSRCSSLQSGAAAFVQAPIGPTRGTCQTGPPQRRPFSFLLRASNSRSSTSGDNINRKENESSGGDLESNRIRVVSDRDGVVLWKATATDKSGTIVPSKSITGNIRPPVHSPRRDFSAMATPPTPWDVPKTINIPEDGVEINFVRSSGAGGQNVNKVNTKVEVRLHIPSAGGWIPQEVRQRLSEQQANRISKEGVLTVTSQEHRTQGQNKKDALDKLRQLILEAWPRPKIRKQRTGVSKATKERNKEFKRQRSETKQNRKRVDNW